MNLIAYKLMLNNVIYSYPGLKIQPFKTEYIFVKQKLSAQFKFSF
jgi:hypothetical protein